MSRETPPPPVDIRTAVKKRADEIQAEDKTAPRPGKRFLSLDEMMAAPVAPEWLLDGYLTADTLVMLYGESTAMKSFVALDMGLCIASGTPWHEVKVSRPGPVAYVAAEGGVGMRKRIRAWATEHHLATPAPFYTLPEPAALPDGPDMDALVVGLEEIAGQHGPLRLVVLDTLARTFGGLDENSSRDMSVYVAALDRLRTTFGCAVLVVHHSGLADKSRARGSSVLRAALDWEMSLEVKDEVRTLSVTKAKDYEAPAPRGFRPKSVGIGWPDPSTGAELTSCVLELTEASPRGRGPKMTGARGVALQALKLLHHGSGRVHLSDWRKEAYRLGVSDSEDLDAKKKAFQRAVKDLREMGRVETSDGYYWPVEEWGDKKGQSGDMSPVSPGVERGDKRGQPPLGGVPTCPLPGTDPMPRGENKEGGAV